MLKCQGSDKFYAAQTDKRIKIRHNEHITVHMQDPITHNWHKQYTF